MNIENTRKIIDDSTSMTAVEILAFTEAIEQLAEARKLLKLAIDDFAKMDYHIYDCDKSCDVCPLSGERDHCFKWRYYDEAFALIGEESKKLE